MLFGVRRFAGIVKTIVWLQAVSTLLILTICALLFRTFASRSPSVSYNKDFITVYDPSTRVLYIYDETLGEAVAKYHLKRPGEKLERQK